MIFVTVGTQLHFDRLVQAVDEWAGRHARGDIFAQIGPTELRPRHVAWARFLDPPQFNQKLDAAELIVAHAGMGSILTALELGKPILVMPRRAELQEHRNDHQLATARRFESVPGVSVALEPDDVRRRLDELSELRPAERIGAHASPHLLHVLREFVSQP